MSTVVIRVEPFGAGQMWRVHHPPGFWLGPTPYGYGISWSHSEGRSDYDYAVEWPPPYDPVRFEWGGHEYVFALEGAGSEEIARARTVQVKAGMSLG